MHDWRGRVGGWLGTTAVVLIGGGLFFVQCVYPFLEDNSVEATCDHPDMAAKCDDSGSIANFFVEMCGRDQVVATGDLIRVITLGQGTTERGPLIEAISCGDREYLTFEIEYGAKFDNYEDVRNAVTGNSIAVLDIYEAWALFEISTAEARRELLAVR